jgi:hypothetical protein
MQGSEWARNARPSLSTGEWAMPRGPGESYSDVILRLAKA